MNGGIVIAEETPLQDDVRALIAELNAAMNEMEPETPDEFNFPMTAEEMAGSETTLWVARRDGAALGCCALRRLGGGLGEVKRMYIRPAARGLGLGAMLIEAVEAKAAGEGLATLALETGSDYHAARRVYERTGFVRCGAFGDYPENPYSVFYSKRIAADALAPSSERVALA